MTSLSSYTTFLKKIQYGAKLQPSRDWFMLLTIALVLIGTSILWNVWTFSRIASGEILGGAIETPKTTNTSTFDKVKAQFAKRAADADRYSFEYHFIDPSRQ